MRIETNAWPERNGLAAAPVGVKSGPLALTPRALEYLDAQRKAARAIVSNLRRRLGPDGFDALDRLVDALDADGTFRLREYLRQKGVREL